MHDILWVLFWEMGINYKNKDPHENLNLHKNEGFQKRVSELKSELNELRIHYQDKSDISVMPEEWRKIYRGPEARNKDPK